MAKITISGGREEKLMEILYHFKVATIEDIRDLVFDGIGKCHVYRRLKELVLLGQIQKVFYYHNGKYGNAYSLTRESFKKCLPQAEGQKGAEGFLSDKIPHDLGILSIYRRFIKSPRITEFITENVQKSNSSLIDTCDLKDWIEHRPDAIIADETPNGCYYLPLECELSIKSGFRYETKLMHYYNQSKIPAVIYICGDERVKRIITKVEEKYCQAFRPKVFYGIIDKWPDPPGQLVFENRRGGQISF